MLMVMSQLRFFLIYGNVITLEEIFRKETFAYGNSQNIQHDLGNNTHKSVIMRHLAIHKDVTPILIVKWPPQLHLTLRRSINPLYSSLSFRPNKTTNQPVGTRTLNYNTV